MIGSRSYALKGVTYHLGSQMSGHYTSSDRIAMMQS